LKRRGYKQIIIKESFNKAHNIPRISLLRYKEKQKGKRTLVGGENSPDFKRLTVWYAPSHTRRIIAARQKALLGVGRFGV
jgi:hypothetical protein